MNELSGKFKEMYDYLIDNGAYEGKEEMLYNDILNLTNFDYEIIDNSYLKYDCIRERVKINDTHFVILGIIIDNDLFFVDKKYLQLIMVKLDNDYLEKINLEY